MVNKASYDRKQQTLFVTVNNESFNYYNVPKFVFNELANAQSREDYFNSNIKDSYKSEKV